MLLLEMFRYVFLYCMNSMQETAGGVGLKRACMETTWNVLAAKLLLLPATLVVALTVDMRLHKEFNVAIVWTY